MKIRRVKDLPKEVYYKAYHELNPETYLCPDKSFEVFKDDLISKYDKDVQEVINKHYKNYLKNEQRGT